MSSEGIPDVNVCETVSVFENITTLPTVTVVSLGLKHPSAVSSQPEPEPEPSIGVIVISECSAKLAGDIEIIPTTKVNNRKIELVALVFII